MKAIIEKKTEVSRSKEYGEKEKHLVFSLYSYFSFRKYVYSLTF